MHVSDRVEWVKVILTTLSLQFRNNSKTKLRIYIPYHKENFITTCFGSYLADFNFYLEFIKKTVADRFFDGS